MNMNQGRTQRMMPNSWFAIFAAVLITTAPAARAEKEGEPANKGCAAVAVAGSGFSGGSYFLNAAEQGTSSWMGPAVNSFVEFLLRGKRVGETEQNYRQGAIDQHERVVEHSKNAAGGVGSVVGCVLGGMVAAGAGAETGALVGSCLGPVGTVAGGTVGFVGGLVGGLVGGIGGGYAAEKAVEGADRVYVAVTSDKTPTAPVKATAKSSASAKDADAKSSATGWSWPW